MGVFGDIGHGLEDGANWAIDKGEKIADTTKKVVGTGIDYGAHKLGEGLDEAGFHGAAHKVEGWGDEIASDLGATPGERQLGESDDPKDLVHGDHGKIVETAKHLKSFYTAFEKVSAGLKRVDSTGWKGEGGDAFRKKFGVHPANWLHAADACEGASNALQSYAETVKWAQDQAKDAIALFQRGKHASENAVSAYNKRIDAYNAKIKANQDPGPEPEPFHDPGKADIEAAREKLGEARKQRNTAASAANGKIKAALAHAPAEPPPLDRLGDDLVDGYQAVNTELTHVAGGIVKGAAGLVNFVRGLDPMDPYNLTHPAEYLQGVSMTLSGLVSTAAHPERALKAAVDGFEKDPSEFMGRLLPQLIGTDGVGLAEGGLKTAATAGAKDVAEQTAVKESTSVAENSAADAAKSNPEKYDTPNPSEKVKDDPSDPIDLTTGKMYLSQTDVALPGALPLVFTRRVESGYRFGRWFGPSWSSTIDQRLEIDSEAVVLVSEDGLLLVYPHPAPGLPALPSHGPRRPLERVDGGYTVTDPQTRRVWHFADRGDDLAILEQIDDANGNWITFEYDADATPLGIVSSAGYDVRISAEAGRVTALRLSSAGDQTLMRYGYTDGHLTEVVNSSGVPLRFTYDEAGRVTSWTDTNNRGYRYEYDDQDRCVAQGGTHGHMALRLSYDETDPDTGLRVTTATTAEGHTRRYVVNDAFQVVAEADPLGAVTRFERDRYHRLLSHTDPLGRRTTFRYDDAGNLISVTRPDGREASSEYNELGLPVKVVNTDGTVVRQTYDDRGNRTSVTEPSGRTTRFAYNEAGHLTSVTDPLGHTTTVVCDRAGLPLEITDPLGAVTYYERDAFGRPAAITDPLGGTTRLEWTTEGHLARRTAPDGTTESWTYDGEGNCTSYTDPMGGVSSFEYTHFDLLASRTGPDGVRYEFEHDLELRLRRVTNPLGLTWTYEYDAAGRLVTETDFDSRRLTYTYDAANRLASRSNSLGELVTFERDEMGRVIRKDAAGQVTTYAYDATDQLARATGPDGTELTLKRDHLGRVRQETVDGRTLTYTYDELGRRNGRTTPTGATTRWAYDAAGRCSGMVASGRVIDFTYDAVGRELARRIGDTVALEQGFDALGRLTTQQVTGAQGLTIQSRTYTYRTDGNLIGIADQLFGSRHFDLDAAGRVTAVHAAQWTEQYAYDAAGNQTQASWPSHHPGGEAVGAREYTGTRITRAGSVRYEHDALGRVTLRQKTRLSRKPDTWRYEWDAEDRLTGTVTPDGTRWRYVYDPLGRRTAKLRLAADGETIVERVDFTWDGTTLCEQTTTSSDLPNPVTLTWDHQGLQPIAQTERITSAEASQKEIDARFFAIVTDLVGAPSELVDEQGEIAWHSRSTIWGTTAWAARSTTYTPLRFPGQYYDPETGLHHNYFRHYDPETARYLTPDPLGLAPAPNPDTYVHNPTIWVDPLGLAPKKPATGTAPSFVAGSDGIMDVRGMGRPDNELVLSGHGGIRAGDGSIVTVPEGTRLHMYSNHGEPISDALGNKIETGNPSALHVYGPGDKLPNYSLFEPDGLNILGTPRNVTVSGETRLSDLLRPNMGSVHWAACRSIIPVG